MLFLENYCKNRLGFDEVIAMY